MVGADPGEGEHPRAQSVLELLYESLAAQRDGGPAIELLLPYAGGELTAAQGTRHVWI